RELDGELIVAVYGDRIAVDRDIPAWHGLAADFDGLPAGEPEGGLRDARGRSLRVVAHVDDRGARLPCWRRGGAEHHRVLAAAKSSERVPGALGLDGSPVDAQRVAVGRGRRRPAHGDS